MQEDNQEETLQAENQAEVQEPGLPGILVEEEKTTAQPGVATPMGSKVPKQKKNRAFGPLKEAFSQACLQEGAKPADFFNEISYKIDLELLYKIYEIQYFSSSYQRDAFALILEVKSEELRELIEAPYLLQVWQHGKKINEVKFETPPRLWGFSSNYLYYQPIEDGEEQDQIVFRTIKGDKSISIINIMEETTYKYITFLGTPSDTLVLATETSIKCVKLDTESIFDSGDETSYTALPHLVIRPKLLLKGIFHPYFMFETDSNQLDFNIFQPMISEESQTYEFIQQSESIPRDEKNDPITKVVSQEVFNESDDPLLYTIALKKSGNIDLYFNCILQYSSFDEKVENIFITPYTLYFILQAKDPKDKQMQHEYYYIDHNMSGSLNFDMAEISEPFDENFIKADIAKDFINLYKNFGMSPYGTTTQAIVAHDQFLSCFDMISNKWITHIKVEAPILQFFHKFNTEDNSEFFYAVLENGQIKHFPEEAFDEEYFEGTYEVDGNDGGNVKGEIKEIIESNDQQIMSLIVTEDEGEMKLYIAINDFTLKINGFLKEKIEKTSRFLILQGNNWYKHSFLHITSKDIIKYDVDIHKYKQDEAREAEEEEQNEEKRKEKEEEEKKKKEQRPTDLSLDEDHEDAGDWASDYLNISCNPKHTIKNFRDKIKKETGKVAGAFHVGVLYSDDEGGNMHYVLADQRHFYVYKDQKKQFFLKEDANIQNIAQVGHASNYVLQKGQTKREDGLYFYNLHDIYEKPNLEKFKVLSLANIRIGLNKFLYYNYNEGRVGYLESLSSIVIIPCLDYCFIKFLGISKPGQYLAYKVHGDKFTALHNSGKMQTWSLISGKLLFQKQDVIDLSGFKNFQQEGKETTKRDRALLVSEEPVEAKLDDYFQNDQLRANLQHQKTFIQTQANEVKHFKYIEIVNEEKVELMYEFYLPTYKYQYLYLSSSRKEPLLIERLNYEKVNLYIKPEWNGKFIKWNSIKRIEDYEADFEGEVRDYLPFYSPDFTYHISLNRKEKKFQIKETISNVVITDIPSDLLQYKENEKAVNAINRLQFMDNETLRVLNLDGIEKIVYFQDKSFDIKAYNRVPFFEDYDEEQGFDTSPYYFERTYLGQGKDEEWLSRKLQQYKSNYNLLDKQSELDLNSVMFNVERHHPQHTCQSFTYLHWSLMEQVNNGKINVSDINESVLQALLMNIVPGGRTCLHLFVLNDQPDDLVEVFKISQPNPSDVSVINYFTPIIRDFNGESPLHIAMRKKDYKSSDLFLKYLKGYSHDMHSKEIQDLLPIFIEKQLPEVGHYLESRMLESEQTKKITKARLREDFPEISPMQLWYSDKHFQEVYIDENPQQIDRRVQCHFIDLPDTYHYTHDNFQDYFKALADTDNFDYFSIKAVQKLIEFNYPLVKEFTIKKLMLPYVVFQFIFVVYFNAFMDNFIDMREYRDIYTNADIMPITEEFIYDLTNLYKMSSSVTSQVELGANAIGYYIQGDYRDGEKLLTALMDDSFAVSYMITLVFCASLLAFAAYFFLNELRQMIDNGALDYLSQIWNYIDILPPCTITASILLLFLNLPSSLALERTVQTITTFFMWLKLLYFMRIFRNTGYLIRMIVVVISDMQSFLLVLVIGLVAFGDTFLCIARGNEDYGGTVFTDNFVGSIIYVYNIILGGFDIADYDDSIAYALAITIFILCTVFNMIVMLNLLIAIISESFANVNSNASQAMYQEMASLISENNYLIPMRRKEAYAAKNQHLFVVTDLEAAGSEFSDPVITTVMETKEEMLTDLQQFHTEFSEFRTAQEKFLQDIANEQTDFKKNLQAFYKMVDANLKNQNEEAQGEEE